jgi:hypothetical protein
VPVRHLSYRWDGEASQRKGQAAAAKSGYAEWVSNCGEGEFEFGCKSVRIDRLLGEAPLA